MFGKETIFVSIASYRDSETQPTITNLFETARFPNRIFIGLVLQNDPELDKDMTMSIRRTISKYKGQIRCIELDATYALGPCYARSLAQSLYRGESHVLQIDSHMRMRTNWDDYLLNLWEQTYKRNNNNNPKVILTAYPVGYTLPNEIPDETRGTMLLPWKFDNQGMLRQRGRLLNPSSLLNGNNSAAFPCLLYAAGFNFGPASVIHDVPYDPNLEYLFFGEELSMAVRLYTHGYNLFAPPVTVCFHLWSRSHRPTVQQQSTSSSQQVAIEEKREASRNTVKDQLLGREKQQCGDKKYFYGLGNERSAKEFAEALQIDFENEKLGDNASLGGYLPEIFVDESSSSSLFAEDSLEKKISTLDSNAQELIAFFLGGMDLKK